jgi:acyl-CoA thioesterase-2
MAADLVSAGSDRSDGPESAFGGLIDLTPSGASTAGPCFVGSPAPERFGRTYGGQFLAQALAAAQRTVEPGRRVHSLHAYFLKVGAVDAATTYEVASIRSGRSFASCEVSARQDGGDQSGGSIIAGGDEVFRMLVSFHTPEDGLAYQPEGRYPMETVPPPQAATIDYPAFAAQHPDFDLGGWDGANRPMEVRYLDAPAPDDTDPHTEPQLMWLRVTGGVPDNDAAHAAGLAYLADATLVDNVLLPHGLRWQDARLTGASLDHAMWFHQPARVDEWLLYDQRVETTGGARGLATGRFYDRRGVLVATCVQEGLIRWRG